MPEIPPRLIEAVQAERNRLVPFVGAGLSVSVKPGVFPDWPKLIELLEAEMSGGGDDSEKMVKKVRALREKGKLVEAAEQVVTDLNRGHFARVMARRFGIDLQGAVKRAKEKKGVLDLSGPGAVWRLRPDLVITTNYDSVLSWPFHGQEDESGPRQVRNADTPELIQIHRQEFGGRCVWHLHGTAHAADSLILATSQYERLYGEGVACWWEMAKEAIKSVLIDRPLLFIGFSLDDPFFKALLDRVLELTGRRTEPSWLLARKSRGADGKPREEHGLAIDPEELRRKWNIEVVYYDDHGAPFFSYLHAIGREAFGEPPLPTALREIEIPPTRDEHVRELRELMGGLFLGPEVVADAYNPLISPVTGKRLRRSGDAWTHLREAIHRLGAANPSVTGEARLPAFVRTLRPHCSADLREKLDRWLDRAAGAFGTVSEAVAVGGAPADDGPWYVLVSLPPAEGRADHWRARAWLFSGERSEDLLEGESLVSRAGIEDLVYELVDRIEERGLDPEEVDLAFLLPRELLTERVDQWRPAAEGPFPEPPIGTSYRVTVRPIHARGRRTRRRWQRSWQRWKASAGCKVEVVEGNAADAPHGDALRAIWLEGAALGGGLFRDEALSLGLLASPPAGERASDRGGDGLDAALQVGLPVLLWAREPLSDDSARTAEVVRELLASIPAGRLPDELLRRRRAAESKGDDGDEAALGACLTLVWDDADRVPPTSDRANRLSLTVETA